MAWKTTPTISQSSISLLTEKEISFKIVPSNSVYFKRYPYKVVFNIPFEEGKSRSRQLRYFQLDLTGFIEDVLSGPTRQYLAPKQPSLFIQNYNDLKAALILYKDCVSEVHGPVSQEHLDLLYSGNFKCQSKNKLWYNRHDCKVEVWLPFKFWRKYTNKPYHSAETAELLNYIKDNLNIYGFQQNRTSTTVYCTFDEFLQVYPFLKMSYPNYRLDITKAVLNTM